MKILQAFGVGIGAFFCVLLLGWWFTFWFKKECTPLNYAMCVGTPCSIAAGVIWFLTKD